MPPWKQYYFHRAHTIPNKIGIQVYGPKAFRIILCEVAETALRRYNFSFMNDKSPKPINPQELGIKTSSESHAYRKPTVLRDEGGRIRWNLRGNTDEQNKQLGITQIQAIFLESFPEFDELFSRDEEGKIIEDQREAAELFIFEKIGGSKKFHEISGYSSSVQRNAAEYFEGSYVMAIQKSFSAWGIEFTFIQREDGKTLSSIAYEKRATELRIKDIERKVLELIESGQSFDKESLRQNGLLSIEREVQAHYPGGFSALREKLTLNGRREKGRWQGLEGIERIRKEALSFYESNGIISEKSLNSTGSGYLSSAIKAVYPGGFRQLRKDLGLPQMRREYWSPQIIEDEARAFFTNEGRISASSLLEKGASALRQQISSSYPGGMNQLRLALGIEVLKKNNDYWTPQVIELEAERFYEENGGLSQPLMLKAHRS